MESTTYLRKTPMTYTIINAHSKKDPDTGLLVHTQSLTAKFRRNAPGQVAQWDPERMVENYIRNEVTSGKLDPTDEAETERREYLHKVIKRFVERHVDFQTGIVWKAPTKDDIKKQLEKQKADLEEQLKEYEEIKVTDEDVKKATEAQIKKPDPSTQKMVFGGGVHKGGSTSGTSKRG